MINSNIFRWMFPGERRLATWGANRVLMVQRGDSRQLVAGAYVILAALWGAVGGVIILGTSSSVQR
jgi:hypothetical protein